MLSPGTFNSSLLPPRQRPNHLPWHSKPFTNSPQPPCAVWLVHGPPCKPSAPLQAPTPTRGWACLLGLPLLLPCLECLLDLSQPHLSSSVEFCLLQEAGPLSSLSEPPFPHLFSGHSPCQLCGASRRKECSPSTYGGHHGISALGPALPQCPGTQQGLPNSSLSSSDAPVLRTPTQALHNPTGLAVEFGTRPSPGLP